MRYWILLIFILLITGCSAVLAPVRNSKSPAFHIVKAGETLHTIAWHYAKDFRTLAKLNNLTEPYLIVQGQKILLTSPKKIRAPLKTPPASLPSPQAEEGVSKEPPVVSSEKTTPQKFIWPTLGNLVESFSPSSGQKGIDIAGSEGQPIKAVSNGKVVYSGQGLLGYGNLVILKHDDIFLSAYAHNQTILVQEGDKVKQGSVIATMGKTGTTAVKLHFELRKNGQPVDPLHYLPHR